MRASRSYFNYCLQHATIGHIVLLFMVLLLPTVFAPFHADDFFHLLMLSDDALLTRSAEHTLFGLFSFVDSDAQNRAQLLQYGVLPWWSSEDFYFRFWRPISELSHWLDMQLMPRSALWAHLHSIVWFLALIWPLRLLLQYSLKPSKALLLLALAIFVLDGQHIMTISWIANRNALLAAFFALWVLYFHMRSTRQAGFSIIACGFYLIALACGEIALSILAYVFFYSLLLDPRPRVQRALGFLPYGVISLVYLMLYQHLGFGADTSSTFYISPLTEPLNFMAHAIERTGVYFLAAFMPVMAGSSWIGGETIPWLRPLVLALALLFAALCLWWVYKQQDYFKASPALYFWLLSGIFSIVPVCSTLAQDRLALFQTLGIDIAIAILIYQALSRRAEGSMISPVVAKGLVFIHLLLSPLHLFLGSVFIHKESLRLQEHALSFNAGKALTDKRVFIFTFPMGQASTLMGMRRALSASVPDSVFIAAGVEAQLSVTQLSASQLRLHRRPGFVIGHETSFRSIDKKPFTEQALISMAGVQVLIERVDTEGRAEQLLLNFTEPLDSGRWLFYALNQKGDLQEYTWPSKMGTVQHF